MKDIIAIVSQKGGVGKTTTSVCLGTGLHERGNRVLHIDLDSQGNLSHNFSAENRALTSYELLTRTAKAEEVIINTTMGDIIPGGTSLAIANETITETGKEYRLKEALEPILDNYDYIVIDTSPSVNVCTINALTCATKVIIPAMADIYSLQGIGFLALTTEPIKKYCNRDLIIDGILLTRYNSRAVLNQNIKALLEQTSSALNTRIYETTIRECISIREAQARRQDIFSYAPKSNAVTDYNNFIDEFLKESK